MAILRKGMWVMHGEQICLVFAIMPGGDQVVLHQVLEDGTTKMRPFLRGGKETFVDDEIVCSMSEIRQAKVSEIPAVRIGGVTVEALAVRGYVE